MELSLSSFIFEYKRVTFFKTDDQVEYIRQLASYMDGDMNIIEALHYTKESYELIYGESHIAVEITDMIIDAQTSSVGKEAIIKKFFHPDLAVAFELIRLNSKSMDEVNKVIGLMVKEREVKRDMVSTLFMPLMIFGMGIVVISAVAGVILPMMESRTKDLSLDSPEAQLGRFFYIMFTEFGYIVLPAIGGLIVFYNKLLSSYVYRGRQTLDKIWPFKLYRQFLSLRFLTLMGLLKKSGCDDAEAYEILHAYGSKYFQYFLEHYMHSFSVGEARINYFGSGLLESVQLIRIRRYFHGVNDTVFSNAIINVADMSIRDITMSNKKVVDKWTYFLMLTGLILLGLGVGIVIDGTALSFE